MGYDCEVIAPSLIPNKPGEKRKTDKRDARKLVEMHRSGHLTAVHIPDERQINMVVGSRKGYWCGSEAEAIFTQ